MQVSMRAGLAQALSLRQRETPRDPVVAGTHCGSERDALHGARFVPGQHVRIARSSDDIDPCVNALAQREHAVVVTLDRCHDKRRGRWWRVAEPVACPTCRGRVYGFLEADLEPVETREAVSG